ncbi:mechanosensitive ion channel domain-containing protein [Aerosakkonema sp. BLCC-F183]|uniref:mechanosensitive ion channel domain-containing protein n=1 Tax=Aerosakkonema sp. BLCC-F183 TaxID=3342834 RepID=UPI0035B936B0
MVPILSFATALPGFLPSLPNNFAFFLIVLIGGAIVAFVLYILLFYVLRALFRQMENDAALVSLSVSRGPVLVIFILLSLKVAFEQLSGEGILGWLEKGIDGFLILCVTHWISQLFTQVVVYYLKAYARKTEAVWDDVLIPILDRTIPVLAYLLGFSLFLQTLGVDLTGIGLAVGSITVVIGLAVKDILANFFSGLVLLVDTPFQFGDVISANGSLAVIKNIGIRVTKLYMIDTHCEVYVPNSSLGNQDIINLSRPTPHYAYSIKIGVRVDADPVAATKILKEIVLGHPDTLGTLEEKLQFLDKFYVWDEAQPGKLSKKEAGRIRVLAEIDVNKQLQKIEEEVEDLVNKIKSLERGGLDLDELKVVLKEYLDVVNLVGLRVVTERKGKRVRSRLEEQQEPALKTSLIGLMRTWYEAWLKDPDLVAEDRLILPEEWEQKIEVLKTKMNKLYQKMANPGGDETRLDDYAVKFVEWLRENFKESKNAWKEPKVRLDNITGGGMEFTVKYYVDNIKLEHWERGYRVNNEVRREMIRRLRQAYIYNS